VPENTLLFALLDNKVTDKRDCIFDMASLRSLGHLHETMLWLAARVAAVVERARAHLPSALLLWPGLQPNTRPEDPTCPPVPLPADVFGAMLSMVADYREV
jgi:hypothetical protein